MIRSVLFAMLLFLTAGCSLFNHAPTVNDSVESIESVEKMTALEKFVSTAKIGEKQQLTDEKYGEITAVADDYYYAASRAWCRIVTVKSNEFCDFRLAFCRDEDGAWKEAPVLLKGCEE